MPEYVLESTGTVDEVEFSDLDSFTQGYVQALFFTENAPQVDRDEFVTAEYQADMSEGRTDGTIPGDAGFSDLSATALASIMRDCAAFQERHAERLALVYAAEPGRYSKGQPVTAERAGMFFWYARNGHGVTWTDDHAPGDDLIYDTLGELQDACGWRTPFPELNVYWSDASEVEL